MQDQEDGTDLKQADPGLVDLGQADPGQADLQQANLQKANLREAQAQVSDTCHLREFFQVVFLQESAEE